MTARTKRIDEIRRVLNSKCSGNLRLIRFPCGIRVAHRLWPERSGQAGAPAVRGYVPSDPRRGGARPFPVSAAPKEYRPLARACLAARPRSYFYQEASFVDERKAARRCPELTTTRCANCGLIFGAEVNVTKSILEMGIGPARGPRGWRAVRAGPLAGKLERRTRGWTLLLRSRAAAPSSHRSRCFRRVRTTQGALPRISQAIPLVGGSA